MELSPFSLEHDWIVNWKRLPSNMRTNLVARANTHKEKKALETIACIGLIGKNHLNRFFGLNDNYIKNMLITNKIVRHEVVRNNKDTISIYTLGVNGAKIIQLDAYELNYWLRYLTKDVLKVLLFYQVYYYVFNLPIKPTPKPFTGAVESSGNLIYVYVTKGDTDDLLRYLKWSKKADNRIMIMVEQFHQLKELELFLEDIKVRVVLEADIMTNKKTDENIFYTYDNGKLVR